MITTFIEEFYCLIPTPTSTTIRNNILTNRLKAIDVGWAQLSITLHISIYAAIPLDLNAPSFNIIKLLPLGNLLIQKNSSEVPKKELLSVSPIVQNNLGKRVIGKRGSIYVYIYINVNKYVYIYTYICTCLYVGIYINMCI
jgi:hypothetical protein